MFNTFVYLQFRFESHVEVNYDYFCFSKIIFVYNIIYKFALLINGFART
jgi:hypothetical protein